MVVVRSSRCVFIRSSNDTTLSLDVYVGFEEFLHAFVECVIKPWSGRSVKIDFFTRVLSRWKETPWSIIGRLLLDVEV
jgi:hypothetical protein